MAGAAALPPQAPARVRPFFALLRYTTAPARSVRARSRPCAMRLQLREVVNDRRQRVGRDRRDAHRPSTSRPST